MTDTRLLLAGLQKYRESLDNHIAQLTSDYTQLESRWRAFDAVLKGDYATLFRSRWMQTDARLQAYIEQSQRIKSFLNERIVALEELNRQESGL